MQIPTNSDITERTRLETISQSVYLVTAGCVPGDIAEFGIGKGHTWKVLAETIARCAKLPGNAPRTLHGFDSFQGLPESTAEPDLESPMVQTGTWAKGTCTGVSAESAAERAAQHGANARIYPGWFADALPQIPAGTRFALVHLDCDLYASTAAVLHALFSRDMLSDGAVLLFDDFLENRGSPALGQRRAWHEACAEYQPIFTDLGFYGRCSWRCMVHRPEDPTVNVTVICDQGKADTLPEGHKWVLVKAEDGREWHSTTMTIAEVARYQDRPGWAGAREDAERQLASTQRPVMRPWGS